MIGFDPHVWQDCRDAVVTNAGCYWEPVGSVSASKKGDVFVECAVDWKVVAEQGELGVKPIGRNR